MNWDGMFQSLLHGYKFYGLKNRFTKTNPMYFQKQLRAFFEIEITKRHKITRIYPNLQPISAIESIF